MLNPFCFWRVGAAVGSSCGRSLSGPVLTQGPSMTRTRRTTCNRTLRLFVGAALPSSFALVNAQQPKPASDRRNAVIIEQMPAAPAPLRVLVEMTAADVAHDQERERKSDEHEAKDLLAQQQSAEAARTQVLVGIVTLIVLMVAGGLLFATWRDARRTAMAAERSADIAQSALVV